MAEEIKLTISSDGSCSDPLCNQINNLLDMLTPMVSNYRLEVGAADELNKIALVKRHAVEAAIDRVEDLGQIIDYIQSDLKKLVRLFNKQIDVFAEIEAAKMFGEDNDVLSKLLSECAKKGEEEN